MNNQVIYSNWCMQISPLFYGVPMTNSQFNDIVLKVVEFVKMNHLENLFNDIRIVFSKRQDFTDNRCLMWYPETYLEVVNPTDTKAYRIDHTNARYLDAMRMRILYNKKLYF